MKKLITAWALITTMFIAEKVQAQFTVNLGGSMVSIQEKVTTEVVNSRYGFGYNGLSLGATYNFNVSKGLGIAVGGQFSWEHHNIYKTIFGPLQHRYISNVFYVDIPVMLNYSFNISDNWKISPFVGPMLTYGLGGTLKICDQDYSNAVVHPWYGDYGESFAEHDYKRLDLSAVGGMAFNYKRFNFYGGYRYGILDIDKDDVAKTHTSGVFIGLGYTF